MTHTAKINGKIVEYDVCFEEGKDPKIEEIFDKIGQGKIETCHNVRYEDQKEYDFYKNKIRNPIHPTQP